MREWFLYEQFSCKIEEKEGVKKLAIKKRKVTISKNMKIGIGIFASTCIIALIIFLAMPKNYILVVYDEQGQKEEIKRYRTFSHAYDAVKQQEGFNPAVINEEETIFAIKYGLVNFQTKTCSENTSYTYDDSERTSYTNGCYGADGLYLDTSSDGQQVKFKQSGAIGWVNRDEIQILNYFDDNQVKSANQYGVEDGNIYHLGTNEIGEPNYFLKINIGKALPNMQERYYFSYDGHYFYETFENMVDDYRNNSYQGSINAKSPYYNSYQYVSHRTKSNYTVSDIDWYVENYLGYTQKPTQFPMEPTDSQLYKEGASFINNQNKYGVNAIMMLSLAINESGFGRSEIAYANNNLFGHAAYDQAPKESADGYANVSDSIEIHAKTFIDQGYSNPCDQVEGEDLNAEVCDNIVNRYAGSYFGDKESGMNVRYASDPYWGEKAAQYYRTFEEIAGEKDTNRFITKIVKDKQVNVYSEPNTSSTILYKTAPYKHVAVQILKEVDGEAIDGNTTWYQIQSDVNLSEDRQILEPLTGSYDFTRNIAYVHASYFE